MGIELLGPLRVDGDGVSLQRRDQVVLSALAVRSGEVMAADQLAEAVWGDEPPAVVAEGGRRVACSACVAPSARSLIETTAVATA